MPCTRPSSPSAWARAACSSGRVLGDLDPQLAAAGQRRELLERVAVGLDEDPRDALALVAPGVLDRFRRAARHRDEQAAGAQRLQRALAVAGPIEVEHDVEVRGLGLEAPSR